MTNDGVDVVTCDQAKIGFPLEHGWESKSGKLVPVFFKDPMASELLEGLICSCTSGSRCTNNFSCSQNSLCCTELCVCVAQSKTMKTMEIHIQLAT